MENLLSKVKRIEDKIFYLDYNDIKDCSLIELYAPFLKESNLKKCLDINAHSVDLYGMPLGLFYISNKTIYVKLPISLIKQMITSFKSSSILRERFLDKGLLISYGKFLLFKEKLENIKVYKVA